MTTDGVRPPWTDARGGSSAGWSRTIVIPMFREAGRIGATIEVLAGSDLDDGRTDFLFVDDGSDDGTAAVVGRALAQTQLPARLLRLDRNRGKGAAVRAGVTAATGGVVAFVDADLSTDVDEVDRCMRVVEEGGADVAFASRAHDSSIIAVPQPLFRQLSGTTFNVIIRLLRLTTFSDTQCGLKAFRGDIARHLFRDLTTDGFSFDVEILDRAARSGCSLVEVPVVWKHVEQSRVRTLRDSVDMLRSVISYRWRVRSRPAAPKASEMTAATFDAMAHVEREHWWFRAKRERALEELVSRPIGQGIAVDVGCGTGEFTAELRELGFQWVVGVDVSEYALTHAQKRLVGEFHGGYQLARATADRLPVETSSASALVSMDVIEHLDDDLAALREYARVLEPGGTLVVAVPAYQWAWSAHDQALGHRRRYTARQLEEVVRAAGFRVVRSEYFHSWLVPLALAVRRTPLRRLVGRNQTAEDASFVHPLVNHLLVGVTRAERRLGHFVRIPAGLSVFLVGEAPANEPSA